MSLHIVPESPYSHPLRLVRRQQPQAASAAVSRPRIHVDDLPNRTVLPPITSGFGYVARRACVGPEQIASGEQTLLIEVMEVLQVYEPTRVAAKGLLGAD